MPRNAQQAGAADALSDALHDFFRATRRARGRAAGRPSADGLSLAKYHLLEPLADGPLTNRQLAEFAGVASPTATRMVDVLLARRLVTRLEDPLDRRAVLISLTAKGRDLLAAKMREYDVVRRRIAAALDPHEAAHRHRLAPAPGRRDRRAVTEPVARQHYNVTLAVLAVAALAYALLQTMVAPALPAIQRELDTSTTSVTWVLTVYLLTASVATPVLGRLGDIFGKERMLVLVLCLFALGSIIAALSHSIGMLGGSRGAGRRRRRLPARLRDHPRRVPRRPGGDRHRPDLGHLRNRRGVSLWICQGG